MLYRFLLLTPILVIAGCITVAHLPERPRLECPVPEIFCRPGSFDAVTIDTSSTPSSASGFYLAISQVQGLNFDRDEFGIAFDPRNGRHGIATLRDRGQQGADRLVDARFSRVDEATVGAELMAVGLQSAVGSAAALPDARTLYFTARSPQHVMSDYDVFDGSISNNHITSPTQLPVSLVLRWDAQPTVSPDGRTMYFASDRSGGLGGTDIYVSHKNNNGTWSDATNLGPAINTTCDELSPFVSGDGRWLYFSSSGHRTVGGYDLFRAPIRGDQVGGAENLGRPINTPADEIFPSAPLNATLDTLLYYSSNQTGSKGFDVYVLHRLPRRVTSVATAQPRETTRISGTVRDGRGMPVDSARVTLFEGDPPRKKDSVMTPKSGEYDFHVERGRSYDLTAESPNTLYTHERIDVPASGNTSIKHDIELPDTIRFRVNFPFNNDSEPYEFTLDDRGIPTDVRWVDMIDRAAEFLRRYTRSASTRFEIVGHTDPIGTDAFNMDLGRRRAEFIARQLASRGVESAIFTVRSEGESRPLPIHDNESDELYRARLRRVELIRR